MATEVRSQSQQKCIDLTGDSEDECPPASGRTPTLSSLPDAPTSLTTTPEEAARARWRRMAPRLRQAPNTASLPTAQESDAILGAQNAQLDRPYLTTSQRASLRRALRAPAWSRTELAEWAGRYVHVDYSALEMWALLPSILAAPARLMVARVDCPVHGADDSIQCLRQRIMSALKGAGHKQVARIISHARHHDRGRRPSLLRARDEDIQGFLYDAARGRIPETPKTIRFGAAPVDDVDLKRRVATATYPLFLRELAGAGGDDLGVSDTAAHRSMERGLHDSLKLWKTWPFGGSSDVISVVWHPTGEYFGAGCAASTDSDNMQYNRTNNFLLGCMADDTLRELPDHRLRRRRTAEGPNSTDEMLRVLDHWVSCTVSSVAFSPDGRHLYSASYDKTVKIWDVGSSDPAPGRLLSSVDHEGEVDILTTSVHYPTIFITGSKSIRGGVRAYDVDENGIANVLSELSSKRALAYPNKEMYPSCIQMGLHPATKHLVLAGYSGNDSSEGSKARDGDLCLFDGERDVALRVTPSAQNVFDCVWHPLQPYFAVGCVADYKANRGIRSYVRLYEREDLLVQELECPALDMNEVTWCVDEHYITASCTDSKTYVWDVRNPARPVHILEHSDPIEQMPEPDDPQYRPREVADTGVRFAAWGLSIERFYTGSSDGVVKAWDIRRGPEDVWIADIIELNAGVMCGAFSNDYSGLLLGDASGGLNLLTIQPDGFEDPVGKWKFVHEAPG